MKKYFFILFTGITSILLATCIKEDIKIIQGKTVVEIDATVLNPLAVGTTYPILTRIPPEGRPASAACPDSTLRRSSGSIRVRVNLVGPQVNKSETVGFKIFNTQIDSIAFPATLGFTCVLPLPASTCRQLPMQNSAPYTGNVTGSCTTTNPRQLAVFDAVAGTHYNITSAVNLITIPANSSFGYIDINIINGASSAGQGRFFGIRLDSSGTLLPNPNYNRIGFVIDQR